MRICVDRGWWDDARRFFYRNNIYIIRCSYCFWVWFAVSLHNSQRWGRWLLKTFDFVCLHTPSATDRVNRLSPFALPLNWNRYILTQLSLLLLYTLVALPKFVFRIQRTCFGNCPSSVQTILSFFAWVMSCALIWGDRQLSSTVYCRGNKFTTKVCIWKFCLSYFAFWQLHYLSWISAATLRLLLLVSLFKTRIPSLTGCKVQCIHEHMFVCIYVATSRVSPKRRK